ncbi:MULTISPECIES: hypothetical protein [Chryseobacterium]|uniref:hypothetical protein n=1 Tax=Chryseobacterium TaxID=59732 RepID=UPI00192E196C|nr:MULTISPECIES: hypothetical protein [Chryseobacterium]MCD9616095.1 hypothetical protein [Chryseobacterium gleum]QRA41344.1 hypothetical protein JNG87_11945 [Chryseobacterium cucumeris]
MKKLTLRIDRWIEKTESRWKAIPIKKQRVLTKLFFTGYTLLTLLIIFRLWAKGPHGKDIPLIRHINTAPADLKIKPQAGNSIYSPQNNHDESPK